MKVPGISINCDVDRHVRAGEQNKLHGLIPTKCLNGLTRNSGIASEDEQRDFGVVLFSSGMGAIGNLVTKCNTHPGPKISTFFFNSRPVSHFKTTSEAWHFCNNHFITQSPADGMSQKASGGIGCNF
jgi:hypothetical protein